MFKSTILSIVAILTATAAQADGFNCKTDDGDYTIKAYNHVTPSKGTRSAAVMVISDNNIDEGSKTIAVFKDINDTLVSSGTEYEAEVDLRYNDSKRAGENFMGTKLGLIDTITLVVYHNYNEPLEAGEIVDGRIKMTKRNGDKKSAPVSCKRYLKN